MKTYNNLRDAIFGLAKQPSVGYIASKLEAGAGGWDVYARLSCRSFRGKVMMVWNSRYSALGGDPWAWVEVLPSGKVRVFDNNQSVVVVPAPGTLAAIGD